MPEPIILFAIFGTLLILRVPVAYAVGVATLVSLQIHGGLGFNIVASRMVSGVDSFAFLAMPFFIWAGLLMTVGGIALRLVILAKSMVGHIHGGLSHTVIVTNMIMAGMSGTDLADAAATGSILIPAMKKGGYPAPYAAAIVAAAATIGPIIPPSTAFILYGLITNTSIGRLFLGGAIPGVLMGLYLLVVSYVIAKRRGYPREERVPYRRRMRLAYESIPALAVPLIIVGGILGGVFTPTESAAIAVVYTILIGRFVYRELTFKQVIDTAIYSGKTIGGIMLIIAVSASFGWLLTLYHVGPTLTGFATSITTNPLLFLFLINGLFLILGCIMDTTAIMLLFLPILMPVVMAYGIDPVHFGVMAVVNLMIGLMTPPYGLCMFLVCRIAGIKVNDFVKETWPFLGALFVLLFTITAVPELTLFLPNLFFGPTK